MLLLQAPDLPHATSALPRTEPAAGCWGPRTYKRKSLVADRFLAFWSCFLLDRGDVGVARQPRVDIFFLGLPTWVTHIRPRDMHCTYYSLAFMHTCKPGCELLSNVDTTDIATIWTCHRLTQMTQCVIFQALLEHLIQHSLRCPAEGAKLKAASLA